MSRHIKRRATKRQNQDKKTISRLARECSRLTKENNQFFDNYLDSIKEEFDTKRQRDYYQFCAVKYLRAFESVCEIAGENPSFVVPEYETDAKNLSPTDENGNYKND